MHGLRFTLHDQNRICIILLHDLQYRGVKMSENVDDRSRLLNAYEMDKFLNYANAMFSDKM
jgi:hypothetical protein